jgi:hypothetical protein
MVNSRRRFNLVLCALALCSAMIAQNAFAVRDRVMADKTDGAPLRAAYVQKMEKIDQDKKDCRKDIVEVITPQLAFMDEFSQLPQAGPGRGIKDEAQLKLDALKLTQMKAELTKLGKLLHQTPAIKRDGRFAERLRLFEKRLLDFSSGQERFDKDAGNLLAKSERAVTNFLPFAKAVLRIKKQQACEALWTDLRPALPMNMENSLLKIRARLKQTAAHSKSEFQTFKATAFQLILQLKTKGQVAVDTDDWSN